MGQTIADVVPIAIGIAISPLPVVAVILVLFSERATAASIAFVAGWFGALVAVPVIGITVFSSTTFRAGSSAETGSGWVLVALGTVMVATGTVLVARSMHETEAPKTPAWMNRIEHAGPTTVFGAAVVLAVANPKNLPLLIAGTAQILQSDLPGGDAYIVAGVFALIASLTVVAPVAVFLTMRTRVRPLLEVTKVWLIDNNQVIMAVLVLVLGFVVAMKGVTRLVG